MQASVSGSTITIPPVPLPAGGQSQQQIVDLSPHQGKTARIYLTPQGQPVVNPRCDCWWQVAEVLLPPEAAEQVQIGAETVDAAEEVQTVHSAGGVDTVTLTEAQRIGRVGPTWNPYTLGADYTVSWGEISWQGGGRQPQPDDSYSVEILTSVEQPVYVQQPLPLELAQHNVILFDLPA